MTVEQLIEKLRQYNPKARVVGIHTGTQTYAPYFLDIRRMFETTENVSRGDIDENLSHEQSDDFPNEVIVLSMGW